MFSHMPNEALHNKLVCIRAYTLPWAYGMARCLDLGPCIVPLGHLLGHILALAQ